MDNNITGTIIGTVRGLSPRERIGITGTRKLSRYMGLLHVTGTNGCGNCLLRNVTYPNNYITNTKAVGGPSGSTVRILGDGGRSYFRNTISAPFVSHLSALRGVCGRFSGVGRVWRIK